MEVRWAPKAVKDLDQIFKRIEQDNPRTARDVIQTIYDGCVSLANFPQRGRPGRIPGRREMIFPGLPYVAIYKLNEHAVEISRIWHGAQNWK
jgi:toxin ParE1/3/4